MKLTDKQRRLRAATCKQLTTDGLDAEPSKGSMRGMLMNSHNFPWMTFGVADRPPSVEEICALVRRHDSPGFVAVVQPTEQPFAIVEWRVFIWLMKLARDCEEKALSEAAASSAKRLQALMDVVDRANLPSERDNQR